MHQHAVPEAVVVADPDRAAGAERALANGAQVLVLDDAYQRLDVRRDLNILVMSAETTRAVRWPLPAGPWREGWAALDRADAVIVTRKRATAEAARTLAGSCDGPVPGPVAVAHLGLGTLEGLVSGTGGPRTRSAGSGWWRRRASPIPTRSWPRPRRPARRCRWPPGRTTTSTATRTWPGWPTRPAARITW